MTGLGFPLEINYLFLIDTTETIVKKTHIYNADDKYNYTAKNISGPNKSILKLYFT